MSDALLKQRLRSQDSGGFFLSLTTTDYYFTHIYIYILYLYLNLLNSDICCFDQKLLYLKGFCAVSLHWAACRDVPLSSPWGQRCVQNHIFFFFLTCVNFFLSLSLVFSLYGSGYNSGARAIHMQEGTGAGVNSVLSENQKTFLMK